MDINLSSIYNDCKDLFDNFNKSVSIIELIMRINYYFQFVIHKIQKDNEFCQSSSVYIYINIHRANESINLLSILFVIHLLYNQIIRKT